MWSQLTGGGNTTPPRAGARGVTAVVLSGEGWGVSPKGSVVHPDGVGLVEVPDHGIEVAVAVEVAEGD